MAADQGRVFCTQSTFRGQQSEMKNGPPMLQPTRQPSVPPRGRLHFRINSVLH